MSLYTDSNHADLRFYLERGSRGINGDEPLKYIKIKDMTDAHLKATIEYEKEFRPDNPLLPIYREEVKYRKKL